jgi:hypothetical protein
MSDMPNGIPIQQHQQYFRSIADHKSNNISDIGKKRTIFTTTLTISRQKWPENTIF